MHHATTNIDVNHRKISNYIVYWWLAGKNAHTDAAGVAIVLYNTMLTCCRDSWNPPEGFVRQSDLALLFN